MSNYISSVSSKPTLSAPVVQSRLEHHHSQQLKPQKPEARQQQHQRSKSIKGKRVLSHNRPKENSPSRSKNTSSYNHIDSFDSLIRESRNIDSSHTNNNNLVDSSGVIINNNESHLSGFTFEDDSKPASRKSNERRSRRHHYSDSVDEDQFRNVATVSILRRPQSATDFVKTSNNNNSSVTLNTKTSLDITREEHEFSLKLPSSVDEHFKERRRSDVTSSKVKLVQRRKDIKSVSEALQVVESDVFPQYISTLQDSHEESDVNSIPNPCLKSVSNSPKTEPDCLSQASNTFVFPPLNYSNAIIALEEEMSSKHDDDLESSQIKSSFERPLTKGYKRRSDIYPPVNAPIAPENLTRRASSTTVELQSHVSPFVNEHQPPEHLFSITPPSARRLSNSPNRLMSSKLYAGPTFHNSPAPSDLPLPSFLGKSSSKESSPAMSNASLSITAPSRTSSPSLSSGNSSDDDMFVMDEYPRESVVLRKQRSRELLRMLSPNSSQQNSAAAYMVPERMATSHNPMQVYPAINGLSLTEISEGLRNLLKIHGQ